MSAAGKRLDTTMGVGRPRPSSGQAAGLAAGPAPGRGAGGGPTGGPGTLGSQTWRPRSWNSLAVPAPGEAGLAGEPWPGRHGLSLLLPACSVARCPPGPLCPAAVRPHQLLRSLPRWLPGSGGVGRGRAGRQSERTPPWALRAPHGRHFLCSPQAGWAPSADFSGKCPTWPLL